VAHCYLSNLHILTLLLTSRIGKRTVYNLLQNLTFEPTNIPELREVLLESTNAGLEPAFLTEDTLEESLRCAEKLLENHEKAQVKIIGYCEQDFPQQLRTIPDPPVILYAKGNIECLRPEQSVAVIGTRHPTNYGRERANKIAQKFAEEGLIVISGLAEGCDTAGHEGCLKANGRTVAVLAHGLQMIYPAHNKQLAEQIVNSGGCLISEYWLGTKPFKSSFVERDRLQSGLSAAVVVIETDIKGGTMHTARFCLEQGRTLACIDHVPEQRSEKSRGNQKLIAEEKAIPLRSPDQLESFVAKVFGKSVLSPVAQKSAVLETSLANNESINSASNSIEAIVTEENIATVQPKSTRSATIFRESESPYTYLHQPSTITEELTVLTPAASEDAIAEFPQTKAPFSSETEPVIREIALTKEEDKKVTFETFLNKDEIQRFEAKCKEDNKTTEQVITELIRQYLHSASQKRDKSSRNAGIRESASEVKQLLLLNIETITQANFFDDRLTQKQLAERLKVNEDTIRRNQKKGTEHFKKWSQDKDPDRCPWEYSETSRCYEVVF